MLVHALVSLTLMSNPYLDEARALLDSMQYAQARSKLEYAAAVTTSTREEKREVFALLARACAAEGKLELAEAAFAKLLADDPSAPPPKDAPRIREAYRRAKEKLYPLDFVSLAQAPAPAGRVTLQLKDPWNLVESVVLLESAGEPTFSERPLELAEERTTASAALTPPAPGEPTRWYAEARGGGGKKTLATLGTAAQPFVFGIGEAGVLTSASPVRTAAPWIAVGGAVAAAVTSGVLMGLGWSESARAGQLLGVSERRTADARAHDQVLAGWVVAGVAAVLVVTSVILFIAL